MLGYCFCGIVGAVILIYIILAAPRFHCRRKNFPTTGYAHRGLWDTELPENSYGAFSAAIEKGFGIETDVQLTADGVPVIMHDDNLIRMCGVDRLVSDCTLAELSELRLAGTEERIPTLEGFLALVGGRVPLLIELKGVTTGTELCDVIAPMLDGYNGNFCIESFNPLLLHRMKRLRPKIVRGQLVTALLSQGFPGNKLRNAALSGMLFNFLSRPDFVAFDKKFADGMSIFLCTRVFGAKRFVWTVRGEEELKKAIKNGDIPIFENVGTK